MKTIPDFAVSSQEAGFDKFLKVYNEYFKFDFFGNANFYGAKNGENYQTGQAWITPITPSQAIALLTNQTTDKMNTLANTCFQYDGSDDSKNIIRIMNKNHRSDFKGNDKYFYWIANDIAETFYKMDKDLTEIPPYEYLALLTGKQLTEGEKPCANCKETIAECACMRNICVKCNKPVGNITFSHCDKCFDILHSEPTQESVKESDIRWTNKFILPHAAIALLTGKQLTEKDLIVGNRFECIEDFHDGRINFVKGDIYPCNRNSGISDHRGYNIQVSMDVLNRHFIRAIKEEKMEILKQTDIAEVCEQVINATPSVWINSNGADETTCPFCHAKIYESVGDMGELPHNNNCAYLIAKDLKTRYNGNTK